MIFLQGKRIKPGALFENWLHYQRDLIRFLKKRVNVRV